MGIINENIAITHPQDHYTFVEADLAASQDDTALHRVATSAAAKIDAVQAIMPWSGSIVAIAAKLSADKTAGTLTFNPSINGTVTTFGVSVTTDTQQAYAKQAHGRTRFAAGDLLGCMYSSDANLVPDGSADAAVEIYVVFDHVHL